MEIAIGELIEASANPRGTPTAALTILMSPRTEFTALGPWNLPLAPERTR